MHQFADHPTETSANPEDWDKYSARNGNGYTNDWNGKLKKKSNGLISTNYT